MTASSVFRKVRYLLTAAALLLTGCTPVTAVQERFYAQSAEIQETPTAITLRLHSFDEEARNVCSGSGETLVTAVSEAQIQAGQEIFMGHLELLCFHAQISADLLQTYARTYRLSPSCRLVCLPKETKALPEDAKPLSLTDRLHRSEEAADLPQTDIFTVLSELSDTNGTALIPVYTDAEEKNFVMGILRENQLCGILSESAAKGLCWLRHDNYPSHILTNSRQPFAVSSASVRLSARMEAHDMPVVTVHILIRGKGDKEAARRQVLADCQQAEEETLGKYHADVIGLADCLAHDCPEAFDSHAFDILLDNVRFEHEIQIA